MNSGAEQLIFSLIAGVFIGGAAGYLGTLMLSKRMALVAGPLGHLTLPGIAIALVWGFDVSLGAFPFVVLGIIAIWLLEMRTKLPMEALTAIVFASGVAIAFLFLPIEQAETALVGDISETSFGNMLLVGVLCLALLWTVKNIYSKMTLINISEDLAKSEGIDVRKYNLIYLGAIAVIVALGVKVVGSLLTAALVAIPAATARNLSKNLFQFSLFGLILGAVSSLLGILVFKVTGLPAGPMIIIVATFFFLVSLAFKKY
ncbi:MAG: iron chelate uptake ABC transporter family permease subunit [Candidatus Moranbacteria bacterium]|nr:iron chelate uptake ABC transporter family permease subunit [Candidatus Moranbacteria bacterium]